MRRIKLEEYASMELLGQEIAQSGIWVRKKNKESGLRALERMDVQMDYHHGEKSTKDARDFGSFTSLNSYFLL